MPPKGTTNGTLEDPDEFELLSRETSLGQTHGASTTRASTGDGERSTLPRRAGLLFSGSHSQSSGDEVVTLLRRSTFEFPKRLRLTGGWTVSVELITQSTPSLLAAVIGSVMTGVVFDTVQYWPAFERIGELFILVPVLLNLKGCLEMNLASRLSTSANIGELDIRRTRRAIVIGNLALLQVQTLLIGAVAGLLSFVLGYVTRPHRETWFESALMIVSAMLCASLSSVVLSAFMSSLVLAPTVFTTNLILDNIATPLASSFGDLLTLIILTFLTSLLINVIRTYTATVLLIVLSLALPGFIVLVWKNPYVSELLFEGWSATILSMVISSGAGVLLQRYVSEYEAFPLIFPVSSSLAGNVGCIFASRLSTQFHGKRDTEMESLMKSRENLIVMGTLFAISLPIHLAFLGFVHLLGTFKFGVVFLFSYLIMGALSIAMSLVLAYSISRLCWSRGYNPDNFVMGLIAAITDVSVSILLVIVFKISG